MSETIKSTNIKWHKGLVSLEDREKRNGYKAAVIWFTGLSASGKSTLSHAVEKSLFDQGYHVYVLDGDNVRHGLNKNLGFSHEDRTENIRRIGEVANLFVQTGVISLTAFISPYRADRDMARKCAPEGRFIEVFVKCSLDVCEKRDPKGMYKKARAGEIKNFTGIDAPYEEPLQPELVIETDKETVEECAARVIGYLKQRGFIP